MMSVLSFCLAALSVTNPIATPPTIAPTDLLPEQIQEETQEIVFLDEEEEADALFSDMEVEE